MSDAEQAQVGPYTADGMSLEVKKARAKDAALRARMQHAEYEEWKRENEGHVVRLREEEHELAVRIVQQELEDLRDRRKWAARVPVTTVRQQVARQNCENMLATEIAAAESLLGKLKGGAR